ncbi:MAG: O-antigen ligase family protein [Anaerostipes sp.]|nr:O-antigen ligase family protein [Anaerostipes sp.]
MIFYIIGVLILLYSIIDEKRGFIYFIGFNLFLNSNITLISIPGIPVLSLQDFMIIVYLFISISKRNLLKAKISMPWMTPYVFITISMFFTCFFSIAGLSQEITAVVKIMLETLILLILMWEHLESKKDFIILYKMFTIIFLVSCIYGLFEYSVQINPLTLYEQTLNHDASKVIDNIYEIGTARGYRINSIFFHAIGAGCNWAMYIILTFLLFVRENSTKYVNWISIVTSFLCFICIILTKQRSPFIFLIIGLLASVSIKRKRMYILAIICSIGLIFVWPYLDANLNIVLSIFDKTNSVGGSSIEMRKEQFEAAFHLIKASPIFGLGSKYTSYISNQYTNAVLGMESIWLTSGIMYGIIGMFTNVYLLYYQLVKIIRYYKIHFMFFYVLGYWILESITTTPGLNVALHYTVLMFFIKNSNKYKMLNEDKRIQEWRICNNKIIKKHVY